MTLSCSQGAEVLREDEGLMSSPFMLSNLSLSTLIKTCFGVKGIA